MQLYTFKSGTTIQSADINYNFDQIRQVIGSKSTADALVLPGRMTLGPLGTASISALRDRATDTDRHLHLGWNVNESYSGSEVVLSRIQAGPAMEVRLGTKGFQIFGTTATSGTLENQLAPIFEVGYSSSITLNADWSFVSTQNGNTSPNLNEYRLMFTPLPSPQIVVPLTANYLASTTTYNLSSSNFGISRYHGLSLTVSAEGDTDDADLQVYGSGLDPWTGIVTVVPKRQKMSVNGIVVFDLKNQTNPVITVVSNKKIKNLVVRATGLWK